MAETGRARETPEAFVRRQAPELRAAARRLRALVRATLPKLEEYVDAYGVLRYGHGKGMRDWVRYISGHKAHVNLGFAGGASLPDPDAIVEGSGKSLRHVKIRSVADTKRPAVKRLLVAAGKLDRHLRPAG